jgi:glycosyltransferase involved in cell wall biosynthesis
LVRIVPVGIPLPDLPAPDPGREGRHPLVVTISSLTPRTSVGTFLRAARKVLDVRCGACQFLVVGEGPDEPALRRLSRELKLEKHVTFANPNVPTARILAEADVYVKVPKQQGFGMSVLEAMSWGLPVVASAVGGLIPLVRDGHTGFLVPAGDPDAAAKRILDVLQDSALRQRLGENARETVADSFPYPRMIEKTATIYADVLGIGLFRGITTLVRKASDPEVPRTP